MVVILIQRVKIPTDVLCQRERGLAFRFCLLGLGVEVIVIFFASLLRIICRKFFKTPFGLTPDFTYPCSGTRPSPADI